MAYPPTTADAESLGALFTRLGGDVSGLLHAEVDLYKQEASQRIAIAKQPVILIVVALFLAQASLTTILVGCAFGLAHWIGPLGGGLVAGVIGFAICGVLVMVAVKRLAAVFSPPGASA